VSAQSIVENLINNAIEQANTAAQQAQLYSDQGADRCFRFSLSGGCSPCKHTRCHAAAIQSGRRSGSYVHTGIR